MLIVEYFDIQIDGPDKKVVFKLKGKNSDKSLTIERTPDFEFIEAENQRGAHCYEGPVAYSPRDCIKQIVFFDKTLEIFTTDNEYDLDLSLISTELAADFFKFLELINQDKRFSLEIQ